MEAQVAQAKKFILNYGLVLGILMVVLGVIMYVTNIHLDPHWAFIVASFAIFIAVVVYGIKAFKSENGGFLTLGEAIKVAVGISLIGAILSGIWIVLLATVIEPDYMQQMADMQRDVMVENFPDMTDEQIDNAMEMSARFMNPWFTFITTIVRDLFFGLIIGLIAGLIMRQKRPYEV